MLDTTKLKAEIIKRYTEHKNYLSKIDFWSNIKNPTYFTFKTSQINYRYIKGSSDIKTIEERVSSGKMSILINIPEIKLDDFAIDKIEILQDIELKSDELVFVSSAFEINDTFHTKNIFAQKDINIFDIKLANKEFTFRINTNTNGHIILSCKLG